MPIPNFFVAFLINFLCLAVAGVVLSGAGWAVFAVASAYLDVGTAALITGAFVLVAALSLVGAILR